MQISLNLVIIFNIFYWSYFAIRYRLILTWCDRVKPFSKMIRFVSTNLYGPPEPTSASCGRDIPVISNVNEFTSRLYTLGLCFSGASFCRIYPEDGVPLLLLPENFGRFGFHFTLNENNVFDHFLTLP